MAGKTVPAWPTDLIWTVRVLVVAAAISLAICGKRLVSLELSEEPSFDTFYAIVTSALTTTAAMLGLARRRRGFVIVAAASQLIAGFGSLLYAIMILSAPSFLLRHNLGLLAWNVADLGLCCGIGVISLRHLRVESGPIEA
jgi:hypothetical protein